MAVEGLLREAGEAPRAVEDLGAWPVEPDEVVPAVGDGQGVSLGVAVTTESDRDAAVVVLVVLVSAAASRLNVRFAHVSLH